MTTRKQTPPTPTARNKGGRPRRNSVRLVIPIEDLEFIISQLPPLTPIGLRLQAKLIEAQGGAK